jgi:predicted HTH transcriptional regulator
VFSTEELEDYLRTGYERRGFELKGPGKSDDKRFLAKVARAALSMGNLRDGGYVVIGIDDAAPQAMLPGLDGDQLASWLDYDAVSARLAVYCDPPLSFHLAEHELVTKSRVVVLEISEFADIPHLCACGYPDVLREGGLYVRPRRIPETAEVASSVEMREVVDLAAEKRLRALIETAERAGGAIVARRDTAPNERATDDREQFETQNREAWGE